MASNEAPTPTYARAIGLAIRAKRELLNWRQEDVAEAMRQRGFVDWTRSVVAAIERGTREPSVGETVLLCFSLGENLPSLLAVHKRVSVHGVELDIKSFCGLLGNPDLRLRQPLVKPLGASERARRASATALAQKYAVFFPHLAASWEAVVDAARGEAEQKAGRKLDIDALEVSILSFAEWDQSLTAERDDQVAERAQADASPRTIQALRGHVTRSLVEQIHQAIPRFGGHN